MERIARLTIPDLVPETLRIGEAADTQGREFRFSVFEYIKVPTLQDIWFEMTRENQVAIVLQLAKTLEKLHSLRISDDVVQDELSREGMDRKALIKKTVLGGPRTSFLDSGRAPIDEAMKKNPDQKANIRRGIYIGSS